MANHIHPLSITQDEFDFIRQLVIERKAMRGFEVATAFGMSALAAALGFRETGGKIVTMDAYIEERYGNAEAYRGAAKGVMGGSDGFTVANFFVETFGLSPHMRLKVGWSPDDTATTLTYEFGDGKLDYVFIDAGHWDEAVIADLWAIRPFVRTGTLILIHDIHCFSDRLQHFLVDTFGNRSNPALPGGKQSCGMSFVEVRI
jgi:predicted O-methyltransferase YrrM